MSHTQTTSLAKYLELKGSCTLLVRSISNTAQTVLSYVFGSFPELSSMRVIRAPCRRFVSSTSGVENWVVVVDYWRGLRLPDERLRKHFLGQQD